MKNDNKTIDELLQEVINIKKALIEIKKNYEIGYKEFRETLDDRQKLAFAVIQSYPEDIQKMEKREAEILNNVKNINL